MKPRTIRTVVEDGKTLVLVPLGRSSGKEAALWEDDYVFLRKLGLRPNWFTMTGCHVRCRGSTTGNHISVARVLVNAGPGEFVTFKDGDTLNLRRENLELRKCKRLTRRERDLIAIAA